MTEQETLLERIKSYCIEEGDCWIWAGATNSSGVPVIRIGPNNQSARRLAYIAATGEILTPRDYVRPRCGDKLCVCPDHSFSQDVAKARKEQGKAGVYSTAKLKASRARVGRLYAKLTLEDHAAIRASNAKQDELAAQYGVHRSYISSIQRGRVSSLNANPFAGLFAANDSGRRRA